MAHFCTIGLQPDDGVDVCAPSVEEALPPQAGMLLTDPDDMAREREQVTRCVVQAPVEPVQFAKAFGADVTGVCSTKKVEMVRSLGADQVIDYTQEDVTRNTQQYDVILDAAAYRSIFDYRRILRDGGRYVMIGGSTALLFQAMLLGPVLSLTGKKKMGNMLTRPTQKDLVYLSELVEAGKVAPVIDQCYPLARESTSQ